MYIYMYMYCIYTCTCTMYTVFLLLQGLKWQWNTLTLMWPCVLTLLKVQLEFAVCGIIITGVLGVPIDALATIL